MNSHVLIFLQVYNSCSTSFPILVLLFFLVHVHLINYLFHSFCRIKKHGDSTLFSSYCQRKWSFGFYRFLKTWCLTWIYLDWIWFAQHQRVLGSEGFIINILRVQQWPICTCYHMICPQAGSWTWLVPMDLYAFCIENACLSYFRERRFIFLLHSAIVLNEMIYNYHLHFEQDIL